MSGNSLQDLRKRVTPASLWYRARDVQKMTAAQCVRHRNEVSGLEAPAREYPRRWPASMASSVRREGQVSVRTLALFLCGLIAAGIAPRQADAHFVPFAPESWLVHNERGDPQKIAPCGTSSENPGTPSNVIGQLTGGLTLRLKIRETIFHPGHYRVALAVSARSELPPDPETTTTSAAEHAPCR